MTGTRRCARPGCGGDVAAWLSYDYAGRSIWLDDPAAEIAGHHSGLCAAHAGRLRAPVGWSCVDRRTARPPSAYPHAVPPDEPLPAAGADAGEHRADPAPAGPAGPAEESAALAEIAV